MSEPSEHCHTLFQAFNKYGSVSDVPRAARERRIQEALARLSERTPDVKAKESFSSTDSEEIIFIDTSTAASRPLTPSSPLSGVLTPTGPPDEEIHKDADSLADAKLQLIGQYSSEESRTAFLSKYRVVGSTEHKWSSPDPEVSNPTLVEARAMAGTLALTTGLEWP